ncbi:MAG: hypothetical protein AABY53_02055 [Bdellovibrionota bacterium]
MKHKIQLFIYFFLTINVTQASTEQSCAPIRTSLERLGAIRNQGVSGLCFAYEASDLVSYKLGFRVSAIDIAMSYLKSTQYNKMSDIYNNGGDTKPALAEASRTGFCAESSMPSDEDRIDFSSEPHAKIFDSFMWLEKNSWDDPVGFKMAHDIFPKLTVNNFQAAVEQKKIRQRLSYLQQGACKNRVPYSKMKFVHKLAQKPQQIIKLVQVINQQLENNNIVGIGFYSNDLYRSDLNIHTSDDDSHGTTLVARRWNTEQNSCEYLMRDNFGAQCDLYQSGLDCKSGMIWVNEKFLLKNLFEVEYLE